MLDNMAGAVAGRMIVVAGGNKAGIPCNDAYSLDLDDLAAGWQRLPDFPGNPRIQAVCAAREEAGGGFSLYLWGGFAPAAGNRAASLSTDGYVYSSASGRWEALPSPVDADGETVSLGGGTAVALSGDVILCMGGVHEDIFLQALRKPVAGYLEHPAEWYRFNTRLLAYSISGNQWSEVARCPEAARAGAALVGNGRDLLYIGGELKPGVRAPSVVCFRLRACLNFVQH